MSAELAVEPEETDVAEPVPSWLIPPSKGFTADDLDRLPGLPSHTELIDGSLVLVSPQKLFHMLTLYLLELRLREQAPRHLFVAREMGVVLGERQRPEPDIFVLRRDAITRARHQTKFPVDAVDLAIEVVSPDSVERDRKRKPQLYAEAGIPHFWRVEDDSDKAVVYLYQLDPATHAYGLVGVQNDHIKVSTPFDFEVDLTEVDQL